jgi:crotonobetainyl-CoA:carnitine CoA-transferase CaiB-like acyl-CoA transferase
MTGVATGPLAGVRVLDFCHFLAGPYAALALADLGADVIKVEDPGHPDEARRVGPCFDGDESVYFRSLNWAKRSVGLRLASPEGRSVALDLVAAADVVLDNFRPGVMAKLGLDHDTLAAVNPHIVTVSLSGFGATGPSAARPGYDYTIQALAGVMSLTGEPDGPPGKAGISYVDHAGGLAAALAVCAALVERGLTGLGRHVDVALFDVQVSMLTYLAAWQMNGGFVPGRTPSGSHPSIVPAQTFAAADGYLSIFVGNDPMWARFVTALDDPRAADPAWLTTAGRYEHRTAVIACLQQILAQRPAAEWIDRLTAHGVPCAPVNGIAEALADPQVGARGMVVTVTGDQPAGDGAAPDGYRCVRGPLPTAAPAPTTGAPTLGQHTAEVLTEIGYGADRLRELQDGGVISGAPHLDVRMAHQ